MTRTALLKAYRSMRIRSVRKIPKHNGHVIKCLLTELGRTELAVLGPYFLTSSQIFSSLALTQSIST